MFHFIKIARAGVITDAPNLSEVGLNILNFLLSAAGIIAIIALAISGILYLTAGGDEKKISQAKKSAMHSITGLAVSMSALIIVRTLDKFIK